MRALYSWNKVFLRIMDIKDEYLKTHKSIDYDNHSEEDTIIHTMVENIEDKSKKEFYSNWLETLHIRQNGQRVLLHYNLLASAEEMWSDIYSINTEARSIYIDVENENIILCPMNKFFNVDEVKENEWSLILERIKKASIFEITDKMDGSNQNASWYMDEVVLCGSTACSPEKSWRIVEGYNFIKANEGYTKMIKDYPNKTFCFEFIHPEDVHIVTFKEGSEGLYLLCLRDNLTGEISSYKEMKEIANKYGVLSTKIEEYTLDELLAKRDLFKADEKEGWVLNIDGYRVKFKTTDFLKMHKCFSNTSITKVVIGEVAEGTIDDFMAQAPPRVKELALQVLPEILNYVKQKEQALLVEWNKYKHIEDSKEFASVVKSNVPKELLSYVFCKKNNKEYNFLKTYGGHYKKPHEIGVRNVYMKTSLRDEISDEIEE